MIDSASDMKWSDESWVDDLAQTIIDNQGMKKSKPAKKIVDALLAAF